MNIQPVYIKSMLTASPNVYNDQLTTLASSNTVEDALIANLNYQMSNTASLSNQNHFLGNNVFAQLPSIDNYTTPTSSLQLVSKQFVDVSVSNASILPLNNVFTGSNNFTQLPTTADVTVSTDLQITNKKYVDNQVNLTAKLSANNQLTGINNFSQLPTTNDVTVSTDLQITNKKYVDAQINTTGKLASDNTFTGLNTFNQLPLTADIIPSSSLQITNKKYVDATVLNQRSIRYGQHSYQSLISSSYTLMSPYLGITTGTNNNSYIKSFYINWTSDNINTSNNTATFSLDYFFVPSTTLSSTGLTVSGNKTISSTKISTVAFNGSSQKVKNFNGTFNVSIENSSSNFSVVPILATTSVWNNSASSQVAGTPVSQTHTYITTAVSYTIINFSLVSNSKIRVNIGFPCIANKVTESGWISNLGFSVQLLSHNSASQTYTYTGGVETGSMQVGDLGECYLSLS